MNQGYLSLLLCNLIWFLSPRLLKFLNKCNELLLQLNYLSYMIFFPYQDNYIYIKKKSSFVLYQLSCFFILVNLFWLRFQSSYLYTSIFTEAHFIAGFIRGNSWSPIPLNALGMSFIPLIIMQGWRVQLYFALKWN